MIDLIIPTIGNCSIHFLRQALSSANQLDKSLVHEIHILDNSQDSSFFESLGELVRSFNDSRFVIHQIPERLGMAENWNFGLAKITSPWHLYLHDDDYINVNVFNSLKLSELPDKGFVSFDFMAVRENTQELIQRKPGLNGIIHNTPKFVSTLISTQKLKDIGGWNSKALFALDFLAFVKLESSYSSAHLSKTLGFYRIHSDNASSENQRNKMYGNALPYVLQECFTLFDDPAIRRKLLFHLSSFTYPNNSKVKKATNYLLKLFGLKAWFN